LDVALLRTTIRGLAEFGREREMVAIQEEDLARDGFLRESTNRDGREKVRNNLWHS